MSVPQYTMEELRSSLRRSDVRTLITEGRDDYTLLRNLQKEIGHGDCIPAGGRANVLALHADDHSFSCPASGYLVDSDLWLFTGVPPEFEASQKIVATDGYSIENDVLRDVNVESLIYDGERGAYEGHLDIAIRWYSSGVTARIAGDEFDFDRPMSRIIDPHTGNLTDEAQADILKWPPLDGIVQTIEGDYPRLLRGKTWLGVLNKTLCANGRIVQHPPKGLLEIGMRGGGPQATRLITSLREILL